MSWGTELWLCIVIMIYLILFNIEIKVDWYVPKIIILKIIAHVNHMHKLKINCQKLGHGGQECSLAILSKFQCGPASILKLKRLVKNYQPKKKEEEEYQCPLFGGFKLKSNENIPVLKKLSSNVRLDIKSLKLCGKPVLLFSSLQYYTLLFNTSVLNYIVQKLNDNTIKSCNIFVIIVVFYINYKLETVQDLKMYIFIEMPARLDNSCTIQL
ncbi:hypothetical protein AGLY_008486 [Aphis glycines]|uniref:Uncharacterized protein n=1 Tax=Aphis glycines TaxID=307491 RepID=A0A6G0TLE4_APHGL|nr:hypothetical protein AGLY_008486 [Aphis glycines]